MVEAEEGKNVAKKMFREELRPDNLKYNYSTERKCQQRGLVYSLDRGMRTR